MAAAQTLTPTTSPDPPPATPPIPAAIGRVLSVVRKLIDYGRHLAGTIHQRATAPDFPLFAKPFGTTDLAAILARIADGLRRAAALEARLCRRAARGRDLSPTRIPLPPGYRPRPTRQVAPPDEPQPADPTQDPRLAHLPTAERIAAEVRRRPIGAVIGDICRDLGIMPGDLDRAFWEELSEAIILYGGSLLCFFRNPGRRLFAVGPDDYPDPADPPWPAAPPRLPGLATGPP